MCAAALTTAPRPSSLTATLSNKRGMSHRSNATRNTTLGEGGWEAGRMRRRRRSTFLVVTDSDGLSFVLAFLEPSSTAQAGARGTIAEHFAEAAAPHEISTRVSGRTASYFTGGGCEERRHRACDLPLEPPLLLLLLLPREVKLGLPLSKFDCE